MHDNHAFGIFGAFLHTKSAFFQYFVGTYDNAYGMTIYIYKVLTLWKSMFMRASYKILAFLIQKVLFLSISFCRYFRYFVGTNDTACRLTCTDKFPNVPTKLRKSIIGGGGGLAPLPPSGNDSDTDIALFMTSYTDQETRNLRTF